MRAWQRGKALVRVLRKASRNKSDLARFLVRRPALAAAVGLYESAVLVSNSVDPRVKSLATLRASSLIGCPF